MTDLLGAHAIVVGAGMGGLAAAKALSSCFEQVTVLERDALPNAPEARAGTPHCQQVHVLLRAGLDALIQLFPEFERELELAGAVRARAGLELLVETPGFDPWPQRDFGFDTLCMTRPLVEFVARRLVQQRRNIEFRWSDPSSEIAFTACDFIYSCIVLQHNTPPMIHAILDAAFKALRPGGVILFQVPTYCVEYEFSIETYLRGDVNETDMEMHCLPQSAIFSLARKNGLEVKLVLEDDWTGDRNRYISNSFLLQKLA